jgi:FkbM family methyltransferase
MSMSTPRRVVYWDNIPAPYAVERYNLLAARGNLDFRVWFSRRTDPDRSWDVDESTWRFRGEYVEDPGSGIAAASRFVERLDATRPDLLLSLYGEPQFIVGQVLAHGLGIRTAILALPSYDAWVRRGALRECAKHVLFRAVDAVKVSGPAAVAYAVRYGCPPDRTFSVTQSSNIAHFAQAISETAKRDLRIRLGIQGCVFLCVSRLWRAKGIFVLLEAFARARADHPDISLLLIGDGPDEAEVGAMASAIPGVVMHPFVQTGDLPQYYAASDVFVFPTLGDPHGQVVEEAHAAGLPIIATDAAGDIERRVQDGVSGCIVPAGDVEALARSIRRLADNPGLRASLGAAGRARTASWSHETWTDDFERFVSGAMQLSRRRSVAASAFASTGRLLTKNLDVARRTRAWADKVHAQGILRTLADTILSRSNRVGMRLVASIALKRRGRPVLSKFGSDYGGWIVPPSTLSSGGLCYCAGVGGDISFEEDLLRRTPCAVWSFDPTPASIRLVAAHALEPQGVHFTPVGIWDEIGHRPFFQPHAREVESYSASTPGAALAFVAPCTTVRAFMTQQGHEQLRLLKLSIEGAEWRVVSQLLTDAVPVDVLCIEFSHLPSTWQVARTVFRLHQAGYSLVARERWKFTFVVDRPRPVVPSAVKERAA